MKIRIYCPYFPLPITEGAFQVIADQARSLSELGHTVEMVLVLENPADFVKKASLCLREIGHAGEFRSIQLCLLQDPARRQFSSLKAGYEALRVESSSIKKNGLFDKIIRVLRSLFSQYASPELYFYPRHLAGRSFLTTVDLAIYHYSFAYVWLNKSNLKNTSQKLSETHRAVHFHNLENELFSLRAHASKNPLSRMIHYQNAIKLRAHEQALAYTCEELWFVGARDLEKFKSSLSSYSNLPLRLVSPTYSPTLHQTRKQSFLKFSKTKSSDIVGMIGDLGFQPNLESAAWILEQVAPILLAKQYSGKLLFVGKNASPVLLKMGAKYPFVEFQGFVENVEAFWSEINTMLVPHVSGSGVRIKLLEAIASGVPVLANGAAVERIHPALRTSPLVRVCETPLEWAEALMNEERLQTRTLWINLPLSQELKGKEVYGFLK